jgi:hypothetical protein
VNAKDLSDEQRVARVQELEKHRGYFARLATRMKARQWFIDSAALNAVEAARQATSPAINAIRSDSREAPKEVREGFELPPPN